MLGLIPAVDYHTQAGVMRLGDALMLYTDGMIEVPGRDLEIGIDKLLGAAEGLVVYGFAGGAERLMDTVAPGGADDRALVLLSRTDR
jgi:serine phosphatase RsbU (regulator of sigma subunit)